MAEHFAPNVHSTPSPQWRRLIGPWPAGLARFAGGSSTVETLVTSGANSDVYRVPDAALIVKRLRGPHRHGFAWSRAAIARSRTAHAFPVFGPIEPNGTDLWTTVPELTGASTLLSTGGDPTEAVTARARVVWLLDELARSEILPDAPLRPVISVEALAEIERDPQMDGRHVEAVREDVPFFRHRGLALTHIDLHPHNILWDGQTVWFVDPESVQVASPILALGYAAYTCGRAEIVRTGAAPREIGRRWEAAVPGVTRLLWTAAKAEIMRRLAYILVEERAGRRDWIVDADRHRLAFEEIDAMSGQED